MKKIIAAILAIVVAVSIPLQVFATSIEIVEEGEFVLLSEKEIEQTTLRERKKVDGLRMYVDSENPLFIFRNVSNGKSVWESALDTYNAIPKDIRNFSVIYIDHHWEYNNEEQMAFWEEYLTFTDEHNVPTVVQIENFCTNGTRDAFEVEELVALLNKHDSLIGFVQVELCTTGVSKTNKATERIYERLKSCIKACSQTGALFIWQEMEYIWREKNNYFNYMLKDKELYNLMKSCPQNIILMDKHNGRGRHFSSQSNIVGCWLGEICNNWGVNLENWMWYQEGLRDYDEEGWVPGADDVNYAYCIKYPPALMGIDTIADMVAGSTVYAFEGTHSHSAMCLANSDGEIVFTQGFYDVIYPLYQHVLQNAVPNKEQVKEKIKVAYKISRPSSYPVGGSEARILQGLYCVNPSFWEEKFDDVYKEGTKDWVPSTGRYYVIPILPKYSDAKELLPDAFIMNNFLFYLCGMFITPLKTWFFNSKYEETYTGDGVLYDINDNIYVFNSNEYMVTDSEQTVNYTMSSGKKLNMELVAHTYAIVNEEENGINVNLTNLRLDTDDAIEKSEGEFLTEYITNGKVGDEKNYRTTTMSFTGFSSKPNVSAEGTHGAKMKTDWNESTKTLTLTVVSNGYTDINIEW